MKKHYRRSVNWNMFKLLKGAVGEVAMEELRAKADAHTIFIFEGGYSEENLPTYHSHTMVNLSTSTKATRHLWQRLGLQLQRGNSMMFTNRMPTYSDPTIDGVE